MTLTGRHGLGLALAAVVTASIAGLSQVPYTARRGEDAQVRLAWRFRGERVEECRRLTPEEIERLPVHMRRAEVCEGAILPYRLDVELDGERAAREVIRATGARADRPLYVFREYPLAPGAHHVRVTFTRLGGSERDDAAEEDDVMPARLEIERDLTLAPRQVALITYDAERHTLVVLGHGGPGPVSPP